MPYGGNSEAESGHKRQGGRREPVGGDAPNSLRKAPIRGVDHIVGANRQRRRICCIHDLHRPHSSGVPLTTSLWR